MCPKYAGDVDGDRDGDKGKSWCPVESSTAYSRYWSDWFRVRFRFHPIGSHIVSCTVCVNHLLK